MRRLISVVVLLVATFSVCAQSSEDLRHKVFNATGLLYVQDEGGDLKHLCTGTVFEKTSNGYKVLTASHCVGHDDLEHKKVQLDSSPFFFSFDEDNGDKVFMPASVVFSGYQTVGDDFAVLKVTTKKEVVVVPLGDDTKVEAGDDIINVASPVGLGRQTFTGSVTMRSMSRPVIAHNINWMHAILLQLSVSGGSSGSSVVSEKQKAIIGVLVGSVLSKGTPMVIAIPISRFVKVREEVAQKKYKYFTEDSRLEEGVDE